MASGGIFATLRRSFSGMSRRNCHFLTYAGMFFMRGLRLFPADFW